MGKRQWTTPAQRDWLEGLIPGFTTAQDDKSTSVFFEDTFGKWFKKWPTPAPTQEEIEAAKGNVEKVLSAKEDFVETVRVH
jgi:hypothetical protein